MNYSTLLWVLAYKGKGLVNKCYIFNLSFQRDGELTR